MKLENLGTDFSLLNQENQRIFFFLYSERRAIDLAKPSTFGRVKKATSGKKKGKSIKVTSEILESLRNLKLI